MGLIKGITGQKDEIKTIKEKKRKKTKLRLFIRRIPFFFLDILCKTTLLSCVCGRSALPAYLDGYVLPLTFLLSCKKRMRKCFCPETPSFECEHKKEKEICKVTTYFRTHEGSTYTGTTPRKNGWTLKIITRKWKMLYWSTLRRNNFTHSTRTWRD